MFSNTNCITDLVLAFERHSFQHGRARGQYHASSVQTREPGSVSVFADQLSWFHDPHERNAIPEMFRLVPQAVPEICSRSWYRALAMLGDDRLASQCGEILGA